MENVKINVDEYSELGLGDIYYGLLTFIERYAMENYNPMEIFGTDTSQYATVITTMKSGVKELLDYLKKMDEVYIPSLNKSVKLSTLTMQEQLALEERCKEYLIAKTDYVLNGNLENQNTTISR